MIAERMTISMPIWLAQEVRARATEAGHSMSDELRSLLAAGLHVRKLAASEEARAKKMAAQAAAKSNSAGGNENA